MLRRVGLIGSPDRDELIRLSIRLAERSAEAVMLDPRVDPDIHLGLHEARACGEDLNDLCGCYVADLGLPSPVVRDANDRLDREESLKARLASRRRLVAWNTLLTRLGRRCPVVNPPRTHDLHGLKPWESAVYQRHELPFPYTVATSDPTALSALPVDHGSGWIQKGMVGGYGYTEAFDLPGSREEAEEQLRSGPLMVQERIMGENFRAFVLADEMIGAAQVITQGADATDSRRGEIRIKRVELPAEAEQSALRAVKHWGLLFAAVDFMHDPSSGLYLLLECNSAPFFGAFEKQTGLAISGRLADYLLTGSGKP